MAKLPQYRSQVIAQQAVAGPAPVDTSLSRSLGQVSQGLSQLAQAKNTMMEREARDYTIQSQNSTSVGLSATKDTLTTTAKTGSEYSDGIAEYIESQKQIAIEAAPNPKAAAAVTEYYDNLYSRELSAAVGVSAKINAQNTAAATSEAFNISFNETMKYPNEFDANLEKGIMIIETSDIPENQKESAIRAYENELTFYKYRGLVSQNPQQVLDDLAGDSSTNANLTPEQTIQLTNMASQQVKSNNAVEKQKVSKSISDYITYKNSGGVESRSFDEASLKSIYGSEEGAQIYSQIKDAESFSDNYNKIVLASPDEIVTLLEAEAVAGPEDFATQSKQESAMIRAVKARNDALSNDPASYVFQSDNVETAFKTYTETGDGTSYAQTTIAEQRRLGVPDDYVSVFGTKQAEGMVKQFNQGGDDAATFLSALRDSFGDDFPIVMRDLNRAGLPAAASMVAVLGETSAAGYLSEAVKVGPKTLSDNIGSTNSTDIDHEVRAYLDRDFTETLNASAGGAAQSKQVRDSVNLLAMYYLDTGTETDPGAAAQKAYKDVIGNRYVFQDNYRVPESEDAATIETNLDNYIDNLDYTQIMPPMDESLPLEQRQRVFSLRNRPKWQTRGDDSGVELVDTNNNAMLDMNGEKIYFTWQQIQSVGVYNVF